MLIVQCHLSARHYYFSDLEVIIIYGWLYATSLVYTCVLNLSGVGEWHTGLHRCPLWHHPHSPPETQPDVLQKCVRRTGKQWVQERERERGRESYSNELMFTIYNYYSFDRMWIYLITYFQSFSVDRERVFNHPRSENWPWGLGNSTCMYWINKNMQH